MKRSMLKRNSVEENVDKVKKDASIEERERGGREERKEEMREIESERGGTSVKKVLWERKEEEKVVREGGDKAIGESSYKNWKE